jgi:aspartyl-tRNA(Asn)/glutamyl-tRNA(Gln) amidotransferase subunit A
MNIINDQTLTIAKVAPLIRKHQLSPVELTKALLTRIEHLQPTLNAFITVTSDLALRQAHQAEREIVKGRYRGALHGIPIAIKDLFYTRGIKTTAGSKILRNFVPTENAAVVSRMRAAGTILLGKTNLHEFAFGATNVNPHYGPVHNPWDLDRISGGSSGGSAAAVGAGLCLASLGTDTGGSIRLPAAACGIVGLKPTFGLVPTDGVIPLSFTLDHVGPLCRCVEDTVLVLGVIAGPDGAGLSSLGQSRGKKFPLSAKGIRGLRVGVPQNYFFDRLQREVRQQVLAAHTALGRMGAEIQEVKLERIQETVDLAADIIFPEALTFHWEWLKNRPGDYGEDLRTRMQSRTTQAAVTYLQALEKRRQYAESLKKVMETVDVLAVPTIPIVAPRIGEQEVKIGRSTENVRVALLRLTFPGNLAGLPAISLPCGFSPEKLPIGLQLIGRSFDEATLLRVALAFEQFTPWHKMFPPEPNIFAAVGGGDFPLNP